MEGRKRGKQREGGDFRGEKGGEQGSWGRGGAGEWSVASSALCTTGTAGRVPTQRAPQQARGAGARAVASAACVAEELNSTLH